MRLGDLVVKVFYGRNAARAGPGFGGGATPSGLDEADWDTDFSAEMFTEVVADCGEATPASFGDVFGGADCPGALVDIGWFQRGDLGAHEESDLAVGCGGDLLLGVFRHADSHFHVGLSGADPDVSDEDIVECDAVEAFDGEFVGAAGFGWFDFGEPFAGGVGSGGGRVAGD